MATATDTTAEVGAVQEFTVTVIIRRFDPENDTEPYWQDFDVQMYSTDRVLDALHKVKWEQDGSIRSGEGVIISSMRPSSNDLDRL